MHQLSYQPILVSLHSIQDQANALTHHISSQTTSPAKNLTQLQTGNDPDEDRSDHNHASDEVDEVDEVDESHLEVVFLDYAKACKQPSSKGLHASK